jgi:hypothetical protein
MAFKVQVGPAQIAIHQRQTCGNRTRRAGELAQRTRAVLPRHQGDRHLGDLCLRRVRDLLNGGALPYHAARIFLTNRAFASEDGPIAARTLGLVIGCHFEGGLHEDVAEKSDGPP